MSVRTTLLLSVLLAVLGGGPVLAHARLIRALPRVGATIRGSPQELRLSFSETIEPRRSSVTLRGLGGAAPTGPLALDANDARVVRVPLRERLPPGNYRVDWSVTSRDTHHTFGDFTFSIAP
ncbi:MAG TPA: copper resistance protein CopC [Phenylobacterium sp.]|uniref:copper resistance protein CopC n=1 Tax=Phenylobacterium sp. TaxID=1871053 RepID=UPI002CB57521|nr:copper resistance protein CopC [Phenylobacterium sp.]HSV04289.1 copper resistance protein CopC [Phenylobacterium sp.]